MNKIDWKVTPFLVLNPIFATILTTVYFVNGGGSLAIFIFAIVFAILTNLSITAGYHRLFAHRTYEAHPVLRFIYLFLGTSAFQGSALKWSADHRIHHNKVDTEQDPYSIKKGFWYAHMGWLFDKTSTDPNPKAADLEKDPMIVFQHRYYEPLAFIVGFGFPALVGWMLGDVWGGLIIAGSLRIALTQQSTFFVNSLSHTFGKQTYSDEITARDNFIVAVLTHGEGYHNFHHRFQTDYRNGVRWYHWDPTKWTIQMTAALGMAKNLRRISNPEILKARLHMEEKHLTTSGLSAEWVASLKEKVLEAQYKLRDLKKDYEKLKEDMNSASKQKLEALREQIRQAKLEFEYALKMWRTQLKTI